MDTLVGKLDVTVMLFDLSRCLELLLFDFMTHFNFD